MHMAEPSDIAPIRSKATLQLITISVSNSLSHRERQTSTRKNMPAVDSSDERVDEAQDIGRVLCIGEVDARSQDSDPGEGT